MLKSIVLVATGIGIGFGANAVLAQNTAPFFQVAEINVKDQAAYEASGVDKVRSRAAPSAQDRNALSNSAPVGVSRAA
jgi:hypothetical protein